MLFNKSNSSPNESDADLITMYRNSMDGIYVGKLYQRYTHLVLSICMKYLKNRAESEDAVMEIFEKLLVDLKKHQIDNFKAWLYSVAKNHCLMKLRKDKKMIVHEDNFEQYKEFRVESESEVHLNNNNNVDQLQDAINQLNGKQKVCIELFYLDEKCYQEVSDITGYNLKQVKSHIQNGKRNLKNILVSSNE